MENNIDVTQEVEDEIVTFESNGQTVVLVAINGTYTHVCPYTLLYGSIEWAGVLAGQMVIADRIKEEAPIAIAVLQRMGLKVLLLTGDNIKTAHAIADEVCLTWYNVYYNDIHV